MRKITTHRPSPALVIAIVALFAAMGGTSYAALSISGKNIKNNTVATKDLKNNDIRGKDVRTGTLTGSDIAESKLGKVPSAGKADTATEAGNASTLGGKSLRGVSQWAVVDTNGTVVRSSGGVTVAKLGNAGRYRVSFASSVADCGLNANAGSHVASGDGVNLGDRYIMLAPSTTGPNDVQVESATDAGAETYGPFFITAQC